MAVSGGCSWELDMHAGVGTPFGRGCAHAESIWRWEGKEGWAVGWEPGSRARGVLAPCCHFQVQNSEEVKNSKFKATISSHHEDTVVRLEHYFQVC